MFRRYVEAELDRVRDCPQAAMLSDRVFERLEARRDEICEGLFGGRRFETITDVVLSVL